MEKKGQSSCFIIGGGPSLIGFDFSKLKDKDTITINKSIFDTPNPNYFITVDYTFLSKIGKRRDLFKSIVTTKVFVADFHFSYLQEKDGRIVDVRNNLIYKLNDFDIIIKARSAQGIGYTYNDFRTGLNTGYCALQLAIILGYKKIYLLGMDLNRKEITHYHGGYGERFDKFNSRIPTYLIKFRKGLDQLKHDDKGIEVISCSPVSQLNKNIPYQDIDRIL